MAVRCDPCIGFHTQALAKLGATRQEVDETLGVAVYMGVKGLPVFPICGRSDFPTRLR